MSRHCPRCRTELVPPFLSCEMCPWSQVRPNGSQRPESPRMDYTAKVAYEAGGKRSTDLTEQQWYNVCRFWPTVAARCERALPDIGPHNPLHHTSKQGPLMRRVDVDANSERLAIQTESA